MTNKRISQLNELGGSSGLPAPDADLIPIVDVSQSSSETKKITYGNFLRGVPDGTKTAPGVAFGSSSNTGIYSPSSGTLAFSANDTYIAKFTSNGFQVGDVNSTPQAQVHIKGSDSTSDAGDDSGQVIVENTADNGFSGPDVVLFRNRPAGANGDFTGQIIFRASDANGAEKNYARITSKIVAATTSGVATQTGLLQFNQITNDTETANLSIANGGVGVNNSDPKTKLHVFTNTSGTACTFECQNNSATDGGGLTIYRHRGSSAPASSDGLGTIKFNSTNSNITDSSTGDLISVPYAEISTSIVSTTAAQHAGKLTISAANGTNGSLDEGLTVANDHVQAHKPVRLAQGTKPTSVSSTGVQGEIRWDQDHVYLCIATDTWRRIPLSSWS